MILSSLSVDSNHNSCFFGYLKNNTKPLYCNVRYIKHRQTCCHDSSEKHDCEQDLAGRNSVFNEVFGRGVIRLSNYDCQTVLPIIALIIFFLHVYLLNLDKSERSERISI